MNTAFTCLFRRLISRERNSNGWLNGIALSFNFGVFLANEAADENRRKKHREKNKHIYEIDFSTAIRTARKFYIRRLTDKPVDIIRLLCRFVHAVKEKYRQFSRPLRGIGAIRFSYR